MIEVGRLCVKTAGRDSRKQCVVVDVLDDNYVMIDGETRRRKCNIKHLEPLKEKISIKKGDSHDKILAEFKKLGVEIKDSTPKKAGERPKKQKKQKKSAEDKPKESKSKKESKPKKAEKKKKEASKGKSTNK